MLTGSLFFPLSFKTHSKGRIERGVCVIVSSVPSVVIFVDFRKILVKSFRKLILTKLYTCSFQTLICFQMICKFFWTVRGRKW